MSQEERLMILQMVADKKISATEAAELLKALDAKPAQTEMPPSVRAAAGFLPPAPPAPPSPPAPPAPPVASSGVNFGAGLGSFIQDVVERVASTVGEMAEPRYEFPYEATGEFADTTVPLRIFTGNGRVEVKAWNEPGFKALIVVKARGNNEEEARARAKDRYTLEAGPGGFYLETRKDDWSDFAVHVTLMVPFGKRYTLETKTGNGNVVVTGLNLADGRVTSGNGSLKVLGGRSDRLFLRTGNGSMEIESNVADVDATSGNGSVTLRPEGPGAKTLKAATGNGSVRVNIQRLPAATGFKLEANTGMGGVDLNVPNLVYERDVRTLGHKHVVARSANFDQAADRVQITARTGLGSVTIE